MSAAESFSFDETLGLLAAGLTNPKANNLMYKPHKKQRKFHKSDANGRQYIGGNRSGKTTGGINEDIWWLTGRHPYLKLPEPPIIGRVTTVDFNTGAQEIIIPQLSQWLAPSDLINGSWEDSYNKQFHKLTLANGSELEIRSYDQDLEKFAGVPRHFVHFDEEPPKDIFMECKARLVDYNGRWWMTMTPVEGMTWTLDEIFESENHNIHVTTVDIKDNPYLSKAAVKMLMEGYDEDERNIRGRGKYVPKAGFVYKHFQPEVHVIKGGVPNKEDWVHYRSLDAGYTNPTAVLYHAVHKRTGVVVTYREHYKAEWTVEQHAEMLKAIEKEHTEQHGITYFLSVADPAIKQRQQTTGHSIQIEYSKHGIYWALGNNNVEAGNDKMNNYLRLGKWFITEDCPNLIRETRRLRVAEYATSKLREKNNKQEKPVKKNDHSCDSARYFFSFQPDLDPNTPTPKKIEPPNLLGAPTIRVGFQQFDTNLQKQSEQIYVIDENVGEW